MIQKPFKNPGTRYRVNAMAMDHSSPHTLCVWMRDTPNPGLIVTTLAACKRMRDRSSCRKFSNLWCPTGCRLIQTPLVKPLPLRLTSVTCAASGSLPCSCQAAFTAHMISLDMSHMMLTHITHVSLMSHACETC